MDQLKNLIETIPYLLGIYLVDRQGVQIIGHSTINEKAVELTEAFLQSLHVLTIYERPEYIITSFEDYELVQFLMDGIVLAIVGTNGSQFELVKIGKQLPDFVSTIKKQMP